MKKKEFYEINRDILNNAEFNELKKMRHHDITRYDHCLRVSYYTYKVTKFLHLNYIEATRAALLHDFFTTEVMNENGLNRLLKHPAFALENAKNYFELSPLQEDIIISHMFPVGLKVPKHVESWLVDILDDIASVYERIYAFKLELSAASTFLFLLLLNYIRMV